MSKSRVGHTEACRALSPRGRLWGQTQQRVTSRLSSGFDRWAADPAKDCCYSNFRHCAEAEAMPMAAATVAGAAGKLKAVDLSLIHI